ncbi:MAG TPA: pyruvate dehydrogenase (acetyl-transferring) E1 component subunit alpha [Actinomycetota bacterium]|nr:pyruvate dehydrogenase (acetyl-transferring) E1 component subunit alpha [Actinomycetota bacterium]
MKVEEPQPLVDQEPADVPFRLLTPDGTLQGDLPPGLDRDRLRDLYRLMALVRRADLEATALQRQGELAVWAPLSGQEAAQVGSAFALQPQDMAFPSYREMGAAVVRGVDIVDYLHFYRGTWHGGMYDPAEHGFGMISVPVASQCLHAVGWAMGAAMDGKDACALAYFGDGATSEGDFHEACNFSAVFKAPAIFFCQNNGWAISVPLSKQTAAPIHRKAAGYGLPGVRVDGNDILAVVQVTQEARQRAVDAGIPTLIEAVTYRLGPHSTADDASIYQPREEVERWQALEPLSRYRTFLESQGIADAAFFGSVDEEAAAIAAKIRAGIAAAPPRPVHEMFQWVYEQTPQHLARQRDEVLHGGQDADA